MEVVESCVWFGTYLALDMVLATVHRFMDRETFIHHCIFGAVCFIMFRQTTAPLVGSALLAQELSTPALNIFQLLRGYRGVDSLATQLAFGVFALSFFALRVGLNIAVVALFLREVQRTFFGPPGASALLYPPVEQAVLAVVLVGGCALQLYWATTIAKKIVAVLAGGVDKAKDE